MNVEPSGLGGGVGESNSTVAVVVCAYTEQRWAELSDGIRELQQQVGTGDEVIVVIDHNPTLAQRAAEELSDSRTRVIESLEERGLSGARNTGIAQCRGDVVLFLDDDAFPEPGWVGSYRARFLSSPSIMAVGGAVTPKWEGGAAPRWFPPEFGWVVGCDYRGMPPPGSEIRNPIGASMGIRRAAFNVVGRFREQVGRVGELPVGCEETELSIRIRRDIPGARIVRDTAPVVRHLVPLARQRPVYFVRRCYYEGRSKAAVTALVGAEAGLSSERTYVIKTLARGVGAHVADALRGDPWGLARAMMLPVGLFTTTTGFLLEQAKRFRTNSRSCPVRRGIPASPGN